MFNKLQANQQPYMDAGGKSLNAAMYGLGAGGDPGTTGVTQGQFSKGFSPTDFTNNLDPGYKFQLDTGGQAIRNADTPTQGALSGSSLKDLMSFNSGLASTGYQNAFNRFNTTQNNIFGRLSGIAGLGQNAAANTGNNGTTLGTGIAQSQAAQGAATAGGQVGVANALGGNATSLGYLMSGNNNSSVSKTDLANANTSSDPLGALISTQGWSKMGGG
jgi:hypothetical protein